MSLEGTALFARHPQCVFGDSRAVFEDETDLQGKTHQIPGEATTSFWGMGQFFEWWPLRMSEKRIGCSQRAARFRREFSQ